jgi:hypothetical protein
MTRALMSTFIRSRSAAGNSTGAPQLSQADTPGATRLPQFVQVIWLSVPQKCDGREPDP